MVFSKYLVGKTEKIVYSNMLSIKYKVLHLLFYNCDMLAFRWDQSSICPTQGKIQVALSFYLQLFTLEFVCAQILVLLVLARCDPHSNLIFHDLRLLSSQPFLLDHYPITINWP